jgi:SNF2 family DNA or RNA helicase
VKYTPHQYQEYATQRIIEQPAVGLFLEMGLGKTVATLTAIEQLKYDYFEVDRVLVIAPKRVAEDTWLREIEKWDHLENLTISKVLGGEQERIQALRVKADIYVINRENVRWLVRLSRDGKWWPFDMVVVDELSSFKSSKAQRFRALKKVRPLCKRIVGLTGTPAPNGLIDLWSQVYLLDLGKRLGETKTGFQFRYFYPVKVEIKLKSGAKKYVYKQVPKPEAEANIYKKLGDICVSMKAEDWLELPERIDRIVPVQLSDKARAEYRQLEREKLIPLVKGDVVASQAAVLANKLLQMANGAVYDEFQGVHEVHEAKLDALEDLIEAANGNPVLVYHAYKHDRARILQRFPQARVLDTQADIEAWNAGEVPILVAHPASAGHGLNLQEGGHIVIWFGLTWSLELYQQANARLHRQGQEHAVIVHHIVAENTLDEQVMQVLGGKADGQNALMGALKARIEKLWEYYKKGGAGA